MPSILANDMSLEYEDRSERGDPVVVLIMGLGQQMIAWPETLIEALVAGGFRVVRFDNRDVGRSTWLKGKRTVSPAVWITARRFGLRLPVPYTLGDMADDALGLMDALSIADAHVAGVSMGGMIAQLVAVKAPKRVLSLSSIMSSSGARGLPGADPAIQERLLSRPPKGSTRAQLLEHTAETLRMIASPESAGDASEFLRFTQVAADRGYNPAGFIRQFLAILADGSRVRRLEKLTVPTLVIHGAADKLVPLPCGIDTAKRIPGARLEIIDEMAHDLPPSQIPRIASLLLDHARGASLANNVTPR